MLIISVLKGPAHGRVFKLSDLKTHHIGRESGPLELADSRISRDHAELAPTEHGWIVRDLGSTNGTLVNGRRIDGPTHFGDGDQIQVGRSLLRIDLVADEEADSFVAPAADRPAAQAGGASAGSSAGALQAILDRLEHIESRLDDAAPAAGGELNHKLDQLITTIETQPTAAIGQRLTEILRAVNTQSTASLEQRLDHLASALQPVDAAPLQAAVDKLTAHLTAARAADDDAVRQELGEIRTLLESRAAAPAPADGSPAAPADLRPLDEKLELIVDVLGSLRFDAAHEALAQVQNAIAELPAPADPSHELHQLRQAVDALGRSVDLAPLLKKLEHDPAEPLLKQILTVIESGGQDELHEKVNDLLERSARAADHTALLRSVEALREAVETLPSPAAAVDLSPVIERLEHLGNAVAALPAASAVDLDPLAQRLDAVLEAQQAGRDVPTLVDDLRQRIESLPHRLDEGQAMQRLVETQVVGRITPALQELRELIAARDGAAVERKLDALIDSVARLDDTPVRQKLDRVLEIAAAPAAPADAMFRQVLERLEHAPAPQLVLDSAEPVLQQVLQAVREQQPAGELGEPLMREMRETEAMLQRVSEQVDSLSGQVNQQVLGEMLLLLRSIDLQQRQHAEMLDELRAQREMAIGGLSTPVEFGPVVEIEPRSPLRRLLLTAAAVVALPLTAWFAYNSWVEMKSTRQMLETTRATATQPAQPAPAWRSVR